MHSIGIGSKTSTGGAVVEGNGGVMFDGLVASSVGHKATCPACKKGIGPIVAVGPRTVDLPAGPAARAGDYVACGCSPGANVLLAPGSISIDNGSASNQVAAYLDHAQHRGHSSIAPRDTKTSLTPPPQSIENTRTLVQQSSEKLSDQAFAEDYQNENESVENASEEERWKLIGSIDAGGGRVEKSIALDAGQDIKLQAHSITLGLEGFYVDVKPHPLDESGELASTADALNVVVPPMGRFDGIYQLADDGNMRRSFTAGFGTGMSLEFQAPYVNANGFRWFIKIPPQEQIHQNSAGYRIDIYGR